MSKEQKSLVNARQARQVAAKEKFEGYCKSIRYAIDSKDMEKYFNLSKDYIVRKAIKLAQKDGYKIDYKDMEDMLQEGYTALWVQLNCFCGVDYVIGYDENGKAITQRTEFRYTEKQHTGYTTDRQGRKVKQYEPTGKILVYEAWHEVPEQLLFNFLAFRVKADITRAIRSQGRLNYNVGLDQMSDRGYIDQHLNALERRVNAIGNVETLSCLLNNTEYNFLINYLQGRTAARDNAGTWRSVKEEIKAMAYRLIDQNDLRDMCQYIKNQKADRLAELQLAVENKNKTASIIYDYLKSQPDIPNDKYAELMEIAVSRGLAKMLKKIA